jgi:glycosyltransferase involved in cell wall biosynthesis
MQEMPSKSTLQKIWIVVPAFNESTTISGVLNNLLQEFKNIVVVDDGSTDDTGPEALRSGAYLIRHPLNLGQGAALQTGINFALQNNADAIVTFDADGQHCVDDVISLLDTLIAGKFDIVIGSRFLSKRPTGLPLSRLAVLKLATFFTRLSTGLKITDTHNGLRALSSKAASLISIKQNRMSHASEILTQIRTNKFLYTETPVKIIYTDYSLSKGQKISSTLDILKDLLINRLKK